MSDSVEILSSSDEENDVPVKRQKLDEEVTKRSSPKLNNSGNSLKNGSVNQENEKIAEITRLYKDSVEMQEMLQQCYKKIQVENIRDTFIKKVRLLKSHYDAVGPDYIQSEDFKKEMQRKIDICKSSKLAIGLQMFIDVFKEFETVSKRLNESSGDKRAIRKLEKFLRKVHKKITELEEAEVDFSDEDDSSYIKVQRYRKRAIDIYEKLCKYRKENPRAGDITKRKIDFNHSNYLEINHAINREFKNGSKFPTYCDIEQCIHKCVKKTGLKITETEIKVEARSCFEKLGNLLQHRRKCDLLDVHSSYLTSNHDPAADDPQLNETLNKHRSEANKAISTICQKYVKMQEEGNEVKLSDDSDDSHYETSEEDESEK